MSQKAKPLPIVTPLDAPYWEYTRRGELRLQQCGACGALRFPASAVCASCDSDVAVWTRVSGKGRVFSWVVFHKAYFPGFAAEIPYNVAMIALDEGPMFITNVIGVDNADLRKGMRVEVVFEKVSDEFTIPKFRPGAEEADRR